MKEPVPEDLFEEYPRRAGENLTGCDAGRLDSVDLVDRNTLDPGQGENAARRSFPVDGGDLELRVVGEVLAKLGGRRRLEAEIHFEIHRLLEIADDLDRFQAPHLGPPVFDPARQGMEEGNVARKFRLNSRPQYLNGHEFALLRLGEMDLGDRSGGDRFVLEAGEQIANGRIEFAGDDRFRNLRGKGRQAVLEGGEIFRHGLADQVSANRQRLPEFYEAGAERLQRFGEAFAGPGRLVVGRKTAQGGDRPRRHLEPLERQGGAMARKSPNDAQKPNEMG